MLTNKSEFICNLERLTENWKWGNISAMVWCITVHLIFGKTAHWLPLFLRGGSRRCLAPYSPFEAIYFLYFYTHVLQFMLFIEFGRMMFNCFCQQRKTLFSDSLWHVEFSGYPDIKLSHVAFPPAFQKHLCFAFSKSSITNLGSRHCKTNPNKTCFTDFWRAGQFTIMCKWIWWRGRQTGSEGISPQRCDVFRPNFISEWKTRI